MKKLLLLAAFIVLAAALAGGCEDGSNSIEGDNPVTKVENPGDLTALSWSVVATPVYPVTGSDGLIHLAYEIQFTNVTGSAITVRIDSVEVVDPTNDNSVISSVNVIALDGTNITYKVRNYDVPVTFGANNYSDILGPGQFGIMYMDVTFASEADVPQFLGHRVTSSLPDIAGSQPITAIGGYTEVSVRKPIVLGPPLKGDRWVDGDGCCTIIGPHRNRDVFIPYFDSYPILGVDGSLAAVGVDPPNPVIEPAIGSVFAKTGTTVLDGFFKAQVFAGYIDAKSGRRLAYGLYVNDIGQLQSIAEAIAVFTDEGEISAIIYDLN